MRGATPTHIFKFPFAANTINKLRITYKQNGATILEKKETDCTLEENNVKLTLTQEETMLFAERVNVECQIKIKTADGKVLPAKVKTIPVDRLFNEEVL